MLSMNMNGESNPRTPSEKTRVAFYSFYYKACSMRDTSV